MTQQEFYARTGLILSDDEFWQMHEEYCDSPYDKDEFCRLYVINKAIEATNDEIAAIDAQGIFDRNLRRREMLERHLFDLFRKIEHA